MSEHLTNTPHATAAMLDITPVTLRRWCEYHAAYFSAGANPLPGKARRFTGRDIEVLRHVRSLRAQGLTANDINEQLAGITFAEIDNDEHTEDEPGQLATLEFQPSQNAIEPTSGTLVPLDTIIAMQRQIDRIEQARQPSFTMGLALGIIGAGIFFLIIVLVAWLYSSG